MHYPSDKELERLLARSDELVEQSRDAKLKGAETSATLWRLLARSAEVCRTSDALRRAERQAEASPEGEPGAPQAY